ncbi:unnamed protein product [Nippostrongylus brasiliensis]|uniref:Neur_chan_LBD domain-containing protein n=1 Tax=Nippostrongylus brasiliensis TaxID=27835 RepID=A0A0N4YYF8_NIPBR|nr:unnamed protein product [Nippostrongylus brasiliensis]
MNYFQSWKDRRLRWDASEWKTDTLSIKSFGRLWVPDINSDKHQTGQSSADYVTFQSLSSNNNGNVTGRLEFRIQAHCDIDYTEYPSVSNFSRLFTQHLDISQLKTNWQIENSWVKKGVQEGDNK